MYQQTFRALMNEAYALEDEYKEKLKVLERAIKIAEKHGDIDQQFEAKSEYVDAASFAGLIEESLAIFPWLLGIIEQYPDRFDCWDVMWNYKWVVCVLPLYPEIPLKQIELTFKEFENAYQKRGYPKRTVYEYYRQLYIHLGDKEQAQIHHKLMESSEDDSERAISDCLACKQNREVEAAMFFQNYEECLQLAEPILTGKLSCGDIPISTYDNLIYVYIKLNKWDELKSAGQRLLKEHKESEHQDDMYPNVLLYCWAFNKYSTALKYIQEKLTKSNCSERELDSLIFYINAAKVFQAMKQAQKTVVKLQLPESHSLFNADNKYYINDVLNWFLQEVETLVNLFDKRNGNTYYQDYTTEIFNLEKPVFTSQLSTI